MSSRLALALALAALVGCSAPRSTEMSPSPSPSQSLSLSPSPSPSPSVSPSPSPSPSPADPLGAVDQAVEEALARGEAPGAVVVVVRRGEVVLRKAYGLSAVVPAKEPMRVDAVFDLASLTKPLATAISVMQLVEAGRVRLDAKVAQYLPEFAAAGKGEVTVEQLLLHTSGLPADTALSTWRGGREAALANALATPVEAAPGERTRYSDLGFVALGALVERVTGKRLDVYAHEKIFAPLGLHDTAFTPSKRFAERAVPTEERIARGTVHDPRAAAIGGVAGHAGLFATADDLAALGDALAAGGSSGGARVLGRDTTRAMLSPRKVPGGARALGWDVVPSFGGRRGATAVSHTGFTGTSITIDPESGVVAVLLTSRLHPDGHGDVKRLRAEFGDAVRAWVRASDAGSSVLSGLDVLEREGFARLGKRRIGVVTNAAVVDRAGVPLLRRLAEVRSLSVARVFTPEHGLAARAEGQVRDGRDPTTGAPLVSLYGARTQPSAADLEGLDALVVDLPSVGARFFTYVTTLGKILESASGTKLPVFVLDRPPIGGADATEGPLLDDDLHSFTAYHRLPVRFGMTQGELARLFVTERHLDVDLRVVTMEGFDRHGAADDSRPFVPPSPNLRRLDAAVLYPGLALLERAGVSVGRGTDRPFEQIGAPSIDGDALARALAAEPTRGVRITATSFTPSEGAFANRRCEGIAFRITERAALAPVELGLAVARALRAIHPPDFRVEGMLPMLGNRRAFDALVRGSSVAEIEATWRADLDAFRARRRAVLLY